jgi:hypothetical protein
MTMQEKLEIANKTIAQLKQDLDATLTAYS